MKYSFLSVAVLVFQDWFSLYSSLACPGTCYVYQAGLKTPLAFAFLVLVLKACATIAALKYTFLFKGPMQIRFLLQILLLLMLY